MTLEIKKLLELVGIHIPDELPPVPVPDAAAADPSSALHTALDKLNTLIAGGILHEPPIKVAAQDKTIPDTLTFVPHFHPDFNPLEFTLSRQGKPMKVIIERVDFDTAEKLLPRQYLSELHGNTDRDLPPDIESFILLVRALDGTVEGLAVSELVRSPAGQVRLSCNRLLKFDRNHETTIADMGMAMLVAQVHFMDSRGYLHDRILNDYPRLVLYNIDLALLNKYRARWHSPVEPSQPGIMINKPVDTMSADEGRFFLENHGLQLQEVVLATRTVLEAAINYLDIIEVEKGIAWDPETRIHTNHLVTRLQRDWGLKLLFSRCELDALALASVLRRSEHTGIQILEISSASANFAPYKPEEGLWHFFSVWPGNVLQAIKYTGGVHYAVLVDNQVYDSHSLLRSPLPLETYLSLSFPDQELKTKTHLPNALREKLRKSRQYHWARHDGFQKFPALIQDELEPSPQPENKFITLRDIMAARRKEMPDEIVADENAIVPEQVFEDAIEPETASQPETNPDPGLMAETSIAGFAPSPVLAPSLVKP